MDTSKGAGGLSAMGPGFMGLRSQPGTPCSAIPGGGCRMQPSMLSGKDVLLNR